MVLLIFQLKFVQDSQMLLLMQVQTIVAWFFGHDLMCSIDANNCNMRQHRKGINQSDNIVGGLALWCKDDSNFIHSIDSPKVVNFFSHIKSIFNGIYSSHWPVTREKNLVQNQFVNGFVPIFFIVLQVNVKNISYWKYSWYVDKILTTWQLSMEWINFESSLHHRANSPTTLSD